MLFYKIKFYLSGLNISHERIFFYKIKFYLSGLNISHERIVFYNIKFYFLRLNIFLGLSNLNIKISETIISSGIGHKIFPT
jgi:hypothetical protein